MEKRCLIGEMEEEEVDSGEKWRRQLQYVKRCRSEDPRTPSPMDEEGGNGEINPMLIGLVLEKVFPYFSNCLKDLKNFRLVCKPWEKEVIKTIRSGSEIDVMRLIYPHCGCGSMEDVGICQNPVLDYDYDAPFENIRLNVRCETVQDPNIIQWFKIHGTTVKRLRFVSTLTCYHHTRFLECILKIWCKNLATLYLDGVRSYISFSCFSRFDDTPFICQLKELIVHGEAEFHLRLSQDCEKDLVKKYLSFEDDKLESGRLAQAGRTALAEHDDLFVGILRDLAQNPNGADIEEEIKSVDERFGTDGGIFYKLLGGNSIERIVIKNLLMRNSNTFLMALARKPKTVSTLKSFEYGNFQLLVWDDQFRALHNLHLPLTKICLGALMTHMAPEWISALLSSYSNTLQHLEFCGQIVLWDYTTEEEREFITVDIPYLPRVTTFINGNIFCTRVTGLDFVKKLPNLEKCSLSNAIYHSSIFPLNPFQVFNLLFQASAFDNSPHSLKELHLDGKISFTRHVEMLREWFPNLTKLDLTLDGSDVFVEFFQIMKLSELEDLKLAFYSNDNEWCNAGISNSISYMKKLRFLEMIHLSDHPLVITAGTCSNGFAKASKLTSLTLENFGMFVDEVDIIRERLSRIGCVKFPKCILQHRPARVEFSVCRVEIPCHIVQNR